MSLKFNGEAAKQAALDDGAERLLAAAVFYQTQLMQRLNKMNPRPWKTPSKPGEYPRKRTGFAQSNILASAKSIKEVIDQGMTVKLGVATNAAYLLILEFYRGRKGFLDLMTEIEPQIKAILQ